MSQDETQRALLSKGYFPKELPPVFTTADFGQFSQEILSEWNDSKVFKEEKKKLGNAPNKKVRRGSYTYEVESADAELLSKPKRGYERRNLHITHPVPQALLVHELSRHWRRIQSWLLRQTYSMDDLRISSKYDRAVKGINFLLHREKKAYIEATSDWLVKTDITRFYPSIYTHSISWAAYGKEKVKFAMGYYKGSLADRLDLLVRACNRNQTVGIPIGPESSRILAEIISSRLDADFSRLSGGMSVAAVDRLQDDWTVGVGTLEAAEDVLAKISSLYRSYGLDINGSKTSIEHIVAAKQENWVSEIGSFLSHRRGGLHGERLREFLVMCLRLQSEYQFEPVINYALSVVEGSSVSRRDVRNLESFLLKAAVVAPDSMDRVCRVILDLQYQTGLISAKRVSGRFVTLIERNLEKEHHFEAIWLLYTLRGLGRKFSSAKISRYMEGLPSAALGLLLLDMRDRGTFVGGLPVTAWESRITHNTILTDWTWLLGYEGFRHGWLQDKSGLMKGAFFGPMAKRNVVFYDPKRNVKTSRSTVAKRRAVRKRHTRELRQFFLHFRPTERGEY